MTSDKIKKFKQFLHGSGYLFSEDDFASDSRKNRLKTDLVKNGKQYVGYLLLDSGYKTIFFNEMSALSELNKLNFSHGPKLVDYSENEGWMIREKITGDTAGDVYRIDKKNLSIDHFSDSLVEVLMFFATMNPKDGDNVTAQSLTNYLKTKIDLDDPENGQIAELIIKLCDNIGLNEKNIEEKDMQVFLHGDMQPTNLITDAEKNVFVVDFEKAGRGNLLFDFASLYHRGEDNPSWQRSFMRKYIKALESIKLNFDEKAFDLFHMYYLALDVVSLQVVYLKNTGDLKPFRSTNLDKKEASRLHDLYLEILSNKLKSIQ